LTADQPPVGGTTWDELQPKLGIDDLPELERFLFTLR
jgi:hypothetical protein